MKNLKGIKLPFDVKILILLFLLSITTGFLIGIFLGSLSWSLGIGWPNWMRIALIGSSSASVLVWVFTVKSLFVKDGDKSVKHTILFKENENSSTINLSTITTATEKQLSEFAFLIIKRGRTANSSLLMQVFGSRTSGDAFRDEMVHLGFFKWKNHENHNNGFIITKKGLATLRAYCKEGVTNGR